MHEERTPSAADDLDRELAQLLREEAERARPDRRRPRGNQAIEHDDVERGRAKLERVL